MNRTLILSCVVAGALAGCANMSDTEQRTLSGAAIGTAAGVALGAITGEWAWAVGGAAVGAASGFIYDQQRQREQRAFEQGVQEGKRQTAK
ncbi:MAG: glycine zipper domain-containing protein [Burkholderiales bacterium]|nr:glycine zipper domain-containing protein [Burkholderiales bacterium]